MSLKLSFNEGQLQKELIKETRNYLDKVVRGSVLAIQREVALIIEEAIRSQPEYDSLLNGELKYQLGVENSSSILDSIVNAIKNGVEVNYTAGVMTIEIFQPDYANLLSLPGTSFVSERGFDVPWLSWLLFSGDSVILPSYSVNVNPKNISVSRTGGAIMTKNTGSPFRIPVQFSGTNENNWLTRAIDDIEGKLSIVIEKIIERNI